MCTFIFILYLFRLKLTNYSVVIVKIIISCYSFLLFSDISNICYKLWLMSDNSWLSIIVIRYDIFVNFVFEVSSFPSHLLFQFITMFLLFLRNQHCKWIVIVIVIEIEIKIEIVIVIEIDIEPYMIYPFICFLPSLFFSESQTRLHIPLTHLTFSSE